MMSTQVVYCPHCGAANQAGQAQCFACQEKLAGEQVDKRAWTPEASEMLPWWIAPQSERAEQWEVDQPTGPIKPRPAQPERVSRRRMLCAGLAAGGLAAGITALAALRLRAPTPQGRPIFSTGPGPISTPTVAELTADTNQAGRLIVNGRCNLLQLAWKPAVTNDTRILAVNVSSNGSSHLYFWESVSNQFHSISQLQASLGTQSLAWEPAGEHLAIAQPGSIVLGRTNTFGGFDTRANAPLPLPSWSSAFPTSLAWLPDGQNLLYTVGQQVYRWNLAQGMETNAVYTWHTADPAQLVAGTFVGLWLSQNGLYAASTSNMMTESADGTTNDSQITNPLHIWRIGQDQTLAKISPPPNGFTRVQWSPDSRYLVYGNNIQGLMVYDVQAGRTVITDHFLYPGDAVGYSPLSAWLQHGRYVVLPKDVGTDSLPTLQVFEAASGRVALTLEDYHYPIAVSAAQDNRLAVCYIPGGPQTESYLLAWYDGLTGKRLAQQPIPIEACDLQWMPDGSELAVCATDLLSVLNVWVYGQ